MHPSSDHISSLKNDQLAEVDMKLDNGSEEEEWAAWVEAPRAAITLDTPSTLHPSKADPDITARQDDKEDDWHDWVDGPSTPEPDPASESRFASANPPTFRISHLEELASSEGAPTDSIDVSSFESDYGEGSVNTDSSEADSEDGSSAVSEIGLGVSAPSSAITVSDSTCRTPEEEELCANPWNEPAEAQEYVGSIPVSLEGFFDPDADLQRPAENCPEVPCIVLPPRPSMSETLLAEYLADGHRILSPDSKQHDLIAKYKAMEQHKLSIRADSANNAKLKPKWPRLPTRKKQSKLNSS